MQFECQTIKTSPMLAKIILILIAPQLLQIASAQVPQGSAAKSCATTTPLSLREALSLAAADNLSVAIAETAIGSAEATRKQLNSTWFPTLLVTGKYTHTTSPIGIETSLGQMGSGLLPTLAPLIGSNPQLAEIVGDIAATPIGLSLVPRNTASVGADLVWPIFSGGRRLKASSIGDLMVELGHLQYDASLSRTIAEVTTAYFTLSLAESVVELRREAVTTLRQHLHDAQRLEEEGMIVTAERLVAEVNCEQANIELAAAESDVIVARRALVALLGENAPSVPRTTTPLSPLVSLPSLGYLLDCIVTTTTISQLDVGREIAHNNLTIERSRYLPEIALLGHYRLWSKGLDGEIFPRGFVGVGVSWSLFDGLAREGAIAGWKNRINTIETTRTKAATDLAVAIEKYYHTTESALLEVTGTEKSIALAEELLRIKRLSFAEGVATSSEVVDAALLLSEARISRQVAIFTANSSLATLLWLAGMSHSTADYLSPQHQNQLTQQ